jgi:hypothetical protein
VAELPRRKKHCALRITHCALIGRKKDLDADLPVSQWVMRNAQCAISLIPFMIMTGADFGKRLYGNGTTEN